VSCLVQGEGGSRRQKKQIKLLHGKKESSKELRDATAPGRNASSAGRKKINPRGWERERGGGKCEKKTHGALLQKPTQGRGGRAKPTPKKGV